MVQCQVARHIWKKTTPTHAFSVEVAPNLSNQLEEDAKVKEQQNALSQCDVC